MEFQFLGKYLFIGKIPIFDISIVARPGASLRERHRSDIFHSEVRLTSFTVESSCENQSE